MIKNRCIISPNYGKDNNKNLHFYCDYCGEEMEYDEERECHVKRKKCECGYELRMSNYSLGKCFNCGRELK